MEIVQLPLLIVAIWSNHVERYIFSVPRIMHKEFLFAARLVSPNASHKAPPKNNLTKKVDKVEFQAKLIQDLLSARMFGLQLKSKSELIGMKIKMAISSDVFSSLSKKDNLWDILLVIIFFNVLIKLMKKMLLVLRMFVYVVLVLLRGL